ncbi:AlbA family DNA-binding domain-containing protein [Bosea sp. NPDC055332]
MSASGVRNPKGGGSRRNSLTDPEVAVIKALVAADKHSNQEIAGLINRARGDAASDISTGRISNIKNGQIKKYLAIPTAAAAEVDQFMAKIAPTARGDDGPLSPARLMKMFPAKPGAPGSLAITETDQIECKKSVNFVMKTIAAFANNKGGYFVFGVENGSFNVVGLPDEKFEKFDLNKLNQNIRDQLGIGLEIQTTTLQIDGKKIGIVYVGPAHTKPVIFIHNAGDVAQGHIYYRYPGEDRLISPADLQRLIEQRMQQLSQTILSKHLTNIMRFGVENAAVMNLATGEIDGKAGSFLIDEALLPQISFVKDGEFVERSGAPALKLIGEVASTQATVVAIKEALEGYPLTYTELLRRVKKATGVKQGTMDAIIKAKKMKVNKDFSHYAFRNNTDRLRYETTGAVKKGTASNYNEAAVQFLVEELGGSTTR